MHLDHDVAATDELSARDLMSWRIREQQSIHTRQCTLAVLSASRSSLSHPVSSRRSRARSHRRTVRHVFRAPDNFRSFEEENKRTLHTSLLKPHIGSSGVPFMKIICMRGHTMRRSTNATTHHFVARDHLVEILPRLIRQPSTAARRMLVRQLLSYQRCRQSCQ